MNVYLSEGKEQGIILFVVSCLFQQGNCCDEALHSEPIGYGSDWVWKRVALLDTRVICVNLLTCVLSSQCLI